jgi:HK97 family phage prohead protease
MPYDFEGWATKNDLLCSDGVTIKRNAFSINDGKRVPLVWNHQHNSINDVLGHAMLENRDDGVWAKCSFNDSPAGKNAREAVKHGDVTSLSIWANNLQRVGNDIIHGVIREVSLVLAGANPGAFIESVVAHGEPFEEGDEEGLIYTNEKIFISHAEESIQEDKKEEDSKMEEKKTIEPEKKEKTVKEVLDTLTDEQKAAVGMMLQAITENSEKEIKKTKEDTEVKHNMFEGSQQAYISHDDMGKIISDAKRLGSLREAVNANIEEGGVLAHAIDTTGMTVGTGTQTYGINDASMLFPDYKNFTDKPEWISRKMDWVSKVMSKVHHTPFSRVKSMYANITEDEARAKGYIKGKMKKEQVFTTLKRTTDPQTIYKRQKLDRDDIIDITDFDVVAWIKSEMRVMLDEEIARAILIGDGRQSDSDDKIKEDHVRCISKDAPLFNTVVKVTVAAGATQEEIAAETIKAIIRGRKQFKGSGKPDFWTTEDVTTEMLLLEDKMGHAMYKTEGELATKLRVNEIIPVEPMEGQTVSITEGGVAKDYPIIGIVTNLADYNVGADKGGEVNLFDDFDIDYNQQKYLIETRISGALTKPFSALTIVLDQQ